jgi:hypothetical protein
MGVKAEKCRFFFITLLSEKILFRNPGIPTFQYSNIPAGPLRQSRLSLTDPKEPGFRKEIRECHRLDQPAFSASYECNIILKISTKKWCRRPHPEHIFGSAGF